ncbi:MAG TPA: ABATE domain-containing protein [Streptosporangiaceae bacterium]|nr:ABATE domain-containing protein [Streptosporangiaceae bacterium]
MGGRRRACRAGLPSDRDRHDIPAGEIDLAAVRALRAHVTDAIETARTGLQLPSLALRAITEALRSAPAHQELGWSGEAVTIAARRPGDATTTLLAQLAAVGPGLPHLAGIDNEILTQ